MNFKKQQERSLSLIPKINELNNKVNLRIVDSVDGIWIEREHFYERDTYEYDGFTGSGIIDSKFYPLDFYGREKFSQNYHKYDSVESAKQRIVDTDRFRNVVTKTYINV